MKYTPTVDKMRPIIVFCLLVVAIIPLIARADPLDADALDVIGKIRNAVEGSKSIEYKKWGPVSYLKKREGLRTTYVFKVRTDQGYLKIKVIKKASGVTLSSVKAIQKDDPLDFS